MAFQKVPCLSLRAFLTVQVFSFLVLFVTWSQNRCELRDQTMTSDCNQVLQRHPPGPCRGYAGRILWRLDGMPAWDQRGCPWGCQLEAGHRFLTVSDRVMAESPGVYVYPLWSIWSWHVIASNSAEEFCLEPPPETTWAMADANTLV